MKTSQLSIAIITLNEAHNIAQCIQSVQMLSNDIVVVDSLSSDNTVEIATRHGARVFSQEFLGDGQQKQFAANQCRYDWVLSLDADERIADPSAISVLLESIESHKQYAVKRANHILGQRIRHGGSYPDYVIRLFNRKTSHFLAMEHASLVGGETVKTDIELIHYTHPDVSTLYGKMIRSAHRSAEDRVKQNRRQRSATLSACLTFFKTFILRGGFLDGRPGFHWAMAGAFRAFMKHEITRDLRRIQS